MDFMRRTLSWDPAARLSASDALQHPWVMRNGALQSKAVTVGDVLSPSRAKVSDDSHGVLEPLVPLVTRHR